MTGQRLVTGSEAGLTGDDQIRIALRAITENDGIATMPQIYAAVNAVLDRKGFSLSDQGKASLRFFVNKVARDADYVYPYDRRAPGWRITPRGRAYIERIPPEGTTAGMITPAGRGYQLSLSDVYVLLDADRASKSASAGPCAFRHAAVILSVTAWETFIGDTLSLCFTARLNAADTPQAVGSTFNAVAQAWLDDKPKPPDLAKWTGTGWKDLLMDKFTRDISRLNTPSSDKIRGLSKRYLDIDITEAWKWRGTSALKACSQLDRLISLRGQLVHRGSSPAPDSTTVLHEDLLEMVALAEQLAWCTELLASNLR